MSFKNRPVRTEFAYGGVPEDMAYGFAHGGRLVGAPQKNSIFGNTNNEADDGEHHETVRETLERVFNDVNAKEQNNLTNTATNRFFDNGNIPSLSDYDKKFQQVFSRVIDEEGGYEDRQNMIDKPTNFGIQQSTLDNFRKNHDTLAPYYPDNVKNISTDQAAQIYYNDYYNPYRIGEIENENLRNTMFDTFVNHSPQAPVFWIQRAINNNTDKNISVDGKFGSETISSLNSLTDEQVKSVNNEFLDMRLNERNEMAKSNSLYNRITKGIPNRIERLKIK